MIVCLNNSASNSASNSSSRLVKERGPAVTLMVPNDVEAGCWRLNRYIYYIVYLQIYMLTESQSQDSEWQSLTMCVVQVLISPDPSHHVQIITYYYLLILMSLNV